MTSASELADNVQRTASALKDDVRSFGSQALETTREQLIEPTKEALVRVGRVSQDTYASARESLTDSAHQAGDLARDQWDRAARWTRSNPLTAIGIAFAAGIVFAKMALRNSR